MKKQFTLVLVCVLALSLTACARQSQNAPISGSKPTASTAEADAGASSDTGAQATAYFGKIASVVGNEIEINLVKEPEMPEQAQSEGQKEDEMEAAVMVPATPADEAGAGNGGAAERVELEYTGEIKSFIIPAGMSIQDAMGNEKQLSDIKKGSIMNVFADASGQVIEVFLYE